jgi:hypothetical protein
LRFFAALGYPLRWEMMKMLVKHGPLCALRSAVMLRRDFDGVSKHLRVWSAGGVVKGLPGKDRRQIFSAPLRPINAKSPASTTASSSSTSAPPPT